MRDADRLASICGVQAFNAAGIERRCAHRYPDCFVVGLVINLALALLESFLLAGPYVKLQGGLFAEPLGPPRMRSYIASTLGVDESLVAESISWVMSELDLSVLFRFLGHQRHRGTSLLAISTSIRRFTVEVDPAIPTG